MSDAIKWALLVAAVVALIVTILTLPFVQYIDFQKLGDSIAVILSYCSSAFYKVRSIINLLLFDFARPILSGLMLYLFVGWACKLTIKIGAWIIHFIFK